MLHEFLNSSGVYKLSNEQQAFLVGGVDKCCIRVPPNGIASFSTSWCNSKPECKEAGSICAC
ncbi:MAG: hypothetical protein U1C58_10685 [Flavobacteriaceae bacterium]|nr:hypothetical protein [Flavobacteriaceae bacterium]